MPISNYRCAYTAANHEDDIAETLLSIEEITEECSRMFKSESIPPQTKMHIVYMLQVARGVRMS